MIASKNRYIWGILLVYCIVIIVPFLIGAMQSSDEFVFGGFLLNPIDGNTYLAKMFQGWRGDIQFHLPYTSGEGNGSYLFLFYLFLGHVSRLLNLDNLITFHIFRLAGAIFMGWAFIRKLVITFPDETMQIPLTFVGLLGLGSGWLVFFAGQVPPDTWVAEAYPFLSGYANPHFPLGLGLMILMLFPGDDIHFKTFILAALEAFLLAIILPFGIIIVLSTWIGQIFIEFLIFRVWHKIRWKVIYGLVLFLVSGPILVYDFLVVQIEPLLQGWNSQNLTPAPPFLLLVIGLSPVLLFAFVHFKSPSLVNQRTSRTILVWLFASLILLYLPIGLQRRMMTGIFIPAVWLGFYGISRIQSEHTKKIITLLVTGLSVPTTLIVLLAGLFGSVQHAPEIFLWRDEKTALNWIQNNSPENALILTGTQSGLYIPAYTGRRVFYGHPFETVAAESQENWVNERMQEFALGKIDNLPTDLDLVFWGPRESLRYGDLVIDPLPVAFRNEHVTIFQNSPRQP